MAPPILDEKCRVLLPNKYFKPSKTWQAINRDQWCHLQPMEPHCLTIIKQSTSQCNMSTTMQRNDFLFSKSTYFPALCGGDKGRNWRKKISNGKWRAHFPLTWPEHTSEHSHSLSLAAAPSTHTHTNTQFSWSSRRCRLSCLSLSVLCSEKDSCGKKTKKSEFLKFFGKSTKKPKNTFLAICSKCEVNGNASIYEGKNASSILKNEHKCT